MESRTQNTMAHKGMETLFKMNTISQRISRDSFFFLVQDFMDSHGH